MSFLVLLYVCGFYHVRAKEETNMSKMLSKENVRNPTKTDPDIKAIVRKKTYRQRTMEEVAKRVQFTAENATDGEDGDPARETADTTIDVVSTVGRQGSDTVRLYSSKLKSRPVCAQDHGQRDPEKAKARSKKLQKERIRRNYARSAREAQQGAKTAGKKTAEVGKKTAENVESMVMTAMRKIAEFVAEHPIGTLIALLLIIILLAVMCMVNTFGMMFGGISGGSVSASYTAEDREILRAEAAYKAKEQELLEKVRSVESLYPDYDEYVYDTDGVWHDPWSLISALTVVHEDFTASQAQETINTLFRLQYEFKTLAHTEVRYRTEERTGYSLVEVIDEEGNVVDSYYRAYTYYVQVPYSYSILYVTLVDHGIEEAVAGLGFDEDEEELYEYLKTTKGGKEHLF